jgi:hypothetical protein
MASALRRRLLLVGSPYLFGDLLSDIPGDCYEVVKTAEEAAAKWDDGGAARWMAVVAVLDPMAVCGSPDEMVIRAAYALLSGVSLFDYIRVRHGAKTPLACLVNASHRWGLCITMSSCAGKSPELSSGGACFAQGWRLPSSLVVVSCS